MYNTCGIITGMATVQRQTAFRIDPEVMDALHALKARDGVPISEQVRRALRAWLTAKRMPIKAARQQVTRPAGTPDRQSVVTRPDGCADCRTPARPKRRR